MRKAFVIFLLVVSSVLTLFLLFCQSWFAVIGLIDIVTSTYLVVYEFNHDKKGNKIGGGKP